MPAWYRRRSAPRSEDRRSGRQAIAGNCALKPTMGALHRGERQGYSQRHVGVHAGSLTDMAPITTKTIIAVSTPILSLPDRRLRVAEWDMRDDQPPSVQRRCLGFRRRRCPVTSHQILIGQPGNSRLVFTLGAPDRVAPPAADPSPSNRARQKARQPASPRPRTREVSNPVPSSGESTNYLFLSRRRPFNTSGGAWADGTAGPRDVVEVSADVREEPAGRMHRRTAKP